MNRVFPTNISKLFFLFPLIANHADFGCKYKNKKSSAIPTFTNEFTESKDLSQNISKDLDSPKDYEEEDEGSKYFSILFFFKNRIEIIKEKIAL